MKAIIIIGLFIGLAFDIRWIPGFAIMLSKINWSNLTFILCVGSAFFAWFIIGGIICDKVFGRVLSRFGVCTSQLDALKSIEDKKLPIILSFLTGSAFHYLCTLIVYKDPQSLFLIWFNSMFIISAFIEKKARRVSK